MIVSADRQVTLSKKDLLSYIFTEPKQFNTNEPIYIDTTDPVRTVSFIQARNLVRRLITGLRAAGLQTHDCVAVHAANNLHYTLFVLAIIGAGGVFTGTNPFYRPLELEHHLRTSHARFVIVEFEHARSLLDVAEKLDIPVKNIWVYHSDESMIKSLKMRSWKTLLNYDPSDWVCPREPKKTTAARFFSSGTTGLPKAVELTHHNLLAQHSLVFEAHPRPYQMSFLVALPIFHAAMAPLVHIGALRSGIKMYIMSRFEINRYLKMIDRFAITDLIVVPPILHAMVASVPQNRFALRSLRNVVCGAAPLSREMQAKAKSLLGPDVPLTQGWGMTESCCASTMFPYPECDETGSVGRLVPNMEARLLDANGRPISTHNTPGELYIRGPTVTPGYYDNPMANKATFDADDWLRTGDIATYNFETRKWYIIGRRKDMIKVQGFQVSPSEIEAVLLMHPGVEDVAVVGIVGVGCERSRSEQPRAYVVPLPGDKTISEESLRLYVAERLSKYKHLSGGVEFVDAIPRNASGKILRQNLSRGGIKLDGTQAADGIVSKI